MTNNPLRYTDPTGHMADTGANEGGGGCNSLSCFPQAPSNPPSGGGGGSGGGSNNGENSGNGGGSNNSNDDDPEELTDVQLVGQVITFVLIETTVLLPLDYGLLELTTEAAIACGTGVLFACAAEIPILAVDLVAADFQISLANTIAQNVATGERHEFEWIIIPELISTFREPFE